MSERARWVRPLVSATLIGLTALGLNNVYGDPTEVMAQAERAACGAAGCSAKVTRGERSPLGHEYDYALSGGASVTVTCRRALVLLGAWSCAKR
ncbi:MAG: hypothetical protein IT376_18170 [Polyangiaceae bacterium]|nr:hypothetical protein [Polyangiaceae bacterium]